MHRTTGYVTAALLVVTVLGGCGPDDSGSAPSASSAPTAGATTSGAPSTGATTTPATPPVDQAAATQFVESFRFPPEPQWEADVDFPPTVDTAGTTVLTLGCAHDSQGVPGALAVRTVVRPGAESGSARQLAVFADAATAAEVLATVRAEMRACHATPQRFDDGTQVTETSHVGEQLALGAESFWVGTRQVVVNPDGSAGEELFYSTAALYVLEGATITMIEDPAYDDATRAQFVQAASAEWEALRPQLAPLGG